MRAGRRLRLLALRKVVQSCGLAVGTLFDVQAGAQQLPLMPEQLLTRIHANIEAYSASVPDYFCDEAIVSQDLWKGKLREKKRMESMFRVARKSSGDGKPELVETREIRTVDGKATKKRQVTLPFKFSGAVSDAFYDLAPQRASCFDYTVTEGVLPNGSPAIVLSYAGKKTPPGACGRAGAIRVGKAWLDPATMQIVREEEVTFNMALQLSLIDRIAGWADLQGGTMSVAEQFVPVALGGKSFWMPEEVRASITGATKPHQVTYQARYSNYHKYDVSTKVVSAGSGGAE